MSDLEIRQGEAVTESIEGFASVGAGGMLRSAREAQGLHIAMLAVSLKVSVKKLEALESNRFDLLPDMVFVRALASSICRNLKIDERPVLLALPLSEAPKIVGVEHGIRPRFQDARYQSHGGIRKSFKSPWGLALVMVLVAIVAIMFWPERLTIDDLVTMPQSAAPSIAPVPSAPVSLAASEQAMPMPIAADVAAVPVASAKPEGRASDALPVQGEVKSVPAALNSGPLKLLANGNCWVEVVDADGALVFRRTLFQGESTVLGGKLPLSVVLGRADLVSVWVRDQAFDTSLFLKDSVARFQVK
jgi:cytoskeleton protein RodZ